MVDKPYKDDENHDEYQFEDDQEGASYEYKEGGKAPKAKGRFSPKMIIIIVVVLVVIGFIYKLVHIAVDYHRKELVTKELSKSSSATAMSSIQAPSTQAASFNAPAAMLTDVSKATANQGLQSLGDQQQQQITDNTKTLKQLQAMQVQADKRLANVEQGLADMNHQLTVVTESVQQLSANLADEKAQRADKAKLAEQKKLKEDAATRAKKQYYVQAVIPGRVWLKSVDGQTLTAAVGDTVNGYGTVLAIDAYSGAVTTSSGVVIHYGIGAN